MYRKITCHFPMRSSCVYRLCQSQVPRCHDPILQHEPNGRHRISIDPRLFQLDSIRTALVFDIPETKRRLNNGTPFLALVIRDRAIDTFEPNKSSSVTKRGPTIAFLPISPQKLASCSACTRGELEAESHQHTTSVGSCLCPPENKP